MSDVLEDFLESMSANIPQLFIQVQLLTPSGGFLVFNGSPHSGIEHILQVVLGQSRTLYIITSPDSLSHPSGFTEVHWFGVPLVQMNENVHTVPEVRLSSHQNDGRPLVAGTDLRDPFGGDVVKGDRVDQAEAEDEDVHVGVAKRA